jgi:hypothetical protein
MPSCAQRLTVFGDTWRSSATCAVRRYLGSVGWGSVLSRSYCRPAGLGTTLCLSGPDAIERSTQAGQLAMHPGAACFPSRWHAWTLTSLSVLALELRSPLTAVASAQATGMHSHRLAARHAGTPVVTSSVRSRYCAPGRGSRSGSQSAGRACPLAVGASVGPALVDTSKTVEGGTRA